MDDLFQVILSTNRPVPLAVKYFFDLLDEQALHYGIADPETIHIWKTNRYGGLRAPTEALLIWLELPPCIERATCVC